MISVSRRSAKLKMVLRVEAKQVRVATAHEQDVIAVNRNDAKVSDMISNKDDAPVNHGRRPPRIKYDALKFQGCGRRRCRNWGAGEMVGIAGFYSGYGWISGSRS